MISFPILGEVEVEKNILRVINARMPSWWSGQRPRVLTKHFLFLLPCWVRN